MNTFETSRMRRPSRGRSAGWARQRGSALIEFPFAVLILMMMLIIVADLGRLTPWAQQVAYATDAGAQLAYRRYSLNGSDYQEDATGDPANFSEVEAAIKQHIQSAVSGLEINVDDIEVTEIWRCSNSAFSGDTITVNYQDKSGSDCGTGESEVLFIEVAVTDVFDPFTPLIERMMPEDLREQTFTIRRQIFP